MQSSNFICVLVASVCIQVCTGGCSGSSRESSSCWYTLWYIWFVLGLFVIVISVLLVLYIKHRTKERSRNRRTRRSTRTVPIHIAAPMGPPGYAEPSHKPPSYDEAMRNPPIIQTYQHVHVVPGTIVPNNEEYGYQPPHGEENMILQTEVSINELSEGKYHIIYSHPEDDQQQTHGEDVTVTSL